MGESTVSGRCVNVVVADRRPLVLCGLKSVLRAENDFNVVAICRDVSDCMEAIRDLNPDMALVDMSLSPMSGLQILTMINSEQFCTRIVFLSASIENCAGVTAI